MTQEALAGRWDVVIVFRAPGVLADVDSFAPGARKLLWLQDLADMRLANQSIPSVDPVIIVLSRFHADNVRTRLAQFHPGFTPQVVEIPNPIDEELMPDHGPVDRSRLIFFSSPNKGLRHTLAVFRQIQQADPAFTLGIANPGYRTLDSDRLPSGGVFYLGVLPHHRVIEHVRRSLCVLALNHVYPETFGCVFAEANAVGTPVLTHPHGAAAEVLGDPSQLLDVRDAEAVVARVTEWRDGARPTVGPTARFRTDRVAERWRELLQM
jgi:glycosyltransferase involved in cell wall biosynthesis